jgi:hypothetical protein
VVRQSDFFGETITFVDRLDGRAIRSRRSDVDDGMRGVGGGECDVVDSDNGHVRRPADMFTPRLTGEGGRRLPQLTTTAGRKRRGYDAMSDALSSFDNTSLCVLSRGSANMHVGNDADGPDPRAYHASSMAWSELLRHSWEWNDDDEEDRTNIDDIGTLSTAPMLAVACVAPVLAQGGCHYAGRIDELLRTSTKTNNTNSTVDPSSHASPPNLLRMARNAVSYRDAVLLAPDAAFVGGDDSRIIDPSSLAHRQSDMTSPPHHHLLTPRERWHLHAMYQLLLNKHRNAMGAYLRLLELYPGDLLGLSLALDVAYALGDSNAALR